MKKTIGFIGAGNMGGAIIRGLLSGSSSTSVIVADPRKEVLETLAESLDGLRVTTNNLEASVSDILVLAVKPQICETVVRDIRDTVPRETLIVNIAAGITLETLSGWFGGKRKIIRTMPNTPALVSAGMTALCPGEGVSGEEVESVQALFETVGKTVLMPEKLMDAYTALAGSSPAWVFMFLEALADGAVREGIPRSEAYKIAAQAVMGSAKLAVETGLHPGVLKDQVCSPGGTTIEAVATLEDMGFRSAIINAVSDCAARARELGGK